MTEKEKMLAGELYDANYNEELFKERQEAKEICYEFNNLKPSDLKNREKLLKKLFGRTGEKIYIEPNFWCDYGYNISVGENFYMNHNCTILDAAKVEFGDNCFISPNCGFYTSGHPVDYKLRNKGYEYAKPIKIGNNVYKLNEHEYTSSFSVLDLSNAFGKVEEESGIQIHGLLGCSFMEQHKWVLDFEKLCLYTP